MSKFEFNKKTINLEICNKTYAVEDDDILSKKLFNFGVKVQNKVSNIKFDSEDYGYYEKISKELCDEFYILLDSILGKNASKEIFKDRMYDIEDCLSLSSFIENELIVQRDKRMSKYSNSRIQRTQVKQNFKKRR